MGKGYIESRLGGKNLERVNAAIEKYAERYASGLPIFDAEGAGKAAPHSHVVDCEQILGVKDRVSVPRRPTRCHASAEQMRDICD